MSFLPFSTPDLGEEEVAEVVDSLRSGWITTGPKAKLFEMQFTEFLGDPDVTSLAVNSATSGLHLALEALGVGVGDEVVVPTYTFTATAEVVRYLGAIPVFVDIEPDTLNISAKAFREAITERTKVVIPVHFAGLACDMEAIISIARDNNICVVEDAAHALPATFNGKLIGTLDSDATVFSFYANKTMTTAEGGMIVSRNQELIERCKIMRLHGISRDAFDRYVSEKPAWSYEVVAPGYKYNMPDILAAIGICQLKKLTSFQQKREQMAKRYDEELRHLQLTLPQGPKAEEMHAWHLYAVRINKGAKICRDAFIDKMADLGVGCSVHFIPLHLHPYWRDEYKLSPEMFPVAQDVFEREVTLPLYTKMSSSDQSRVISAVEKVLSDV